MQVGQHLVEHEAGPRHLTAAEPVLGSGDDSLVPRLLLVDGRQACGILEQLSG